MKIIEEEEEEESDGGESENYRIGMFSYTRFLTPLTIVSLCYSYTYCITL